MPDTALSNALKKGLEDARSVVVLGVGSELRGDDAVGPRVSRGIARRGIPHVHALDGGTAPENLTAEVRRLAPTHLVIVDSALMGVPPGKALLIDGMDWEGFTFGTHSLPLRMFSNYIAAEVGCSILLIGIQPRSLTFGAGMSPEAEKGAKSVEETLGTALESVQSHIGG